MTLLCCGCRAVGAAAYYLRPPQIQKAEFRFPRDSRVAVLIDAAKPEADNPVFARALYDRLRDYFREYRSPARLVPLRDVLDLRQSDPQAFARWSVQRIGRELGADYVLHVRVDSLRLLENQGVPLVRPQAQIHIKVIVVDHPATDARVWPEEPEGRAITCKRQAREASGPQAVDEEAAKLGSDAAYFVMMPFFNVDLEARRPVEP